MIIQSHNISRRFSKTWNIVEQKITRLPFFYISLGLIFHHGLSYKKIKAFLASSWPFLHHHGISLLKFGTSEDIFGFGRNFFGQQLLIALNIATPRYHLKVENFTFLAQKHFARSAINFSRKFYIMHTIQKHIYSHLYSIHCCMKLHHLIAYVTQVSHSLKIRAHF